MLTREHVCIFIACSIPKKGEYGHKIDDIKKFPLPKDQFPPYPITPEHPSAPLYCYSCGAYAATGRSGVAIKHCPDCSKNPEEFSDGYVLSRLILTYDSVTYHTLFNLFLHWCHDNPEKYRALRAKIKRPRQRATNTQADEMKELFS